MFKKFSVNLSVIMVTYLIPLFILYTTQNDYKNIYPRQNLMFSILLGGSLILSYLNYNYFRNNNSYRWLYIIFLFLGILGLIFSAFALFMIYASKGILF